MPQASNIGSQPFLWLEQWKQTSITMPQVWDKQNNNGKYIHTNASPSIYLTELGMIMLVSPEQPTNAPASIYATELGMVMLVRPEQLLYLQPVITQYFASNKSEIWS